MAAISQYMTPYSSMDVKEKMPAWPWKSACVTKPYVRRGREERRGGYKSGWMNVEILEYWDKRK